MPCFSTQRVVGVLAIALVLIGSGGVRQALEPPLTQDDLQGQWEGKGPPGKIQVIIHDDSLRFFARGDFWYETTFVLVPGTSPRQLRATIVDSAPPARDVGQVVVAIVSLEDGNLRFAVDDGSDEAPTDFEEAMSVYELRRSAGVLAPFDG